MIIIFIALPFGLNNLFPPSLQIPKSLNTPDCFSKSYSQCIARSINQINIYNIQRCGFDIAKRRNNWNFSQF